MFHVYTYVDMYEEKSVLLRNILQMYFVETESLVFTIGADNLIFSSFFVIKYI